MNVPTKALTFREYSEQFNVDKGEIECKTVEMATK